ncbi:MAG: nucleotidyl transferase AbiEii/AbiGii toxin family protein [bacterium]
MFTTGISPATQQVLAILVKVPFVGRYYLAGGTACALYYGHRLSYDLDFFSREPEEPEQITQKLMRLGEWKLRVDQQSEGTWLGELNQVKLSFFQHLYPEVAKEATWEGVRIASKLDIACMKLEAIASRGIKRDFVDMWYLTREIGLGNIFEAARTKYAPANISEMHFLRSLVYFDDAETSQTPNMVHELDWEGVKQYFEVEVARLSREWGI